MLTALSTLLVALPVVLLAGATHAQESRPASLPRRDDTAAEKLGWKLGTQAWTWRDRTAFEAVATAARLGLKYIEFYPGQKLSPAHGELTVGPDLPDTAVADLLAHLRRHGVTAVSYGVVNPTNDAKQARALFAFAKALGLQTITAEPRAGAFDMLETLCQEHGIALALHDHPKDSGSPFWSPELVLAAVGKRSRLLGACADTGHWVRSGLVPVECLKKLEGRVITLHFKDVKGGPGGVLDRPWGLGSGDARGMLEELARQKFRGVISLEYETGKGDALERDAARCIEFFDKTAREIAARK